MNAKLTELVERQTTLVGKGGDPARANYRKPWNHGRSLWRWWIRAGWPCATSGTILRCWLG